MMTKTIFSGFGGQGVLMMGYSLAHSAMSKGYHVTYLPAYGAEVRGGTANCTVAIADEEITSPISSEPDNLVVINQQQANRHPAPPLRRSMELILRLLSPPPGGTGP
ncbi:MAG: hypothetical protein HGB33_12035 [Syntrophaceae bacterium]|nr:hypothetical protein [Syntrophaceae bacterium]